MKSTDVETLYRKISCLITNENVVKKGGRFLKEEDLGIIKDAALVFSAKKGVVWAGKDSEIPKRLKKIKEVSCKGLTAYPGLVDSHTHPAFAGDRANEFSMRLAGKTYQEIGAAGGGILSSVRATKEISEKDLIKKIETRLKTFHDFGVSLVEAKSGYGLDQETEIKSLIAISKASKKSSIAVLSTFLAHAFPQEYKTNHAAYVNKICTEILPAVRKKNLASFCDVFCDEGYFSIENTKQICKKAQSLGLQIKLHGDELANTETAALAAELGALSVDHCLKISDRGIKALSSSETVATLLPATSLYLKEDPAPARKMLDAGAVVALATDFNPGSSPTQNFPFVGSLAALVLEMKYFEVIAAMTYNGAKALGKEKKWGALLPGYRGSPIFCEGDHPVSLLYHLAPASVLRL